MHLFVDEIPYEMGYEHAELVRNGSVKLHYTLMRQSVRRL